MNPVKKTSFKHHNIFQRALEIFPGFVSWNLILFPLWGAFIFPEGVAIFLSCFYLYSLNRSIMMTLQAWNAHFRIKKEMSRHISTDLAQHQDSALIQHFVIIVTYKEPVHILLRTLESLQKQTLNPLQIIPVIAFEERAGQKPNQDRQKEIERRFGKGIFGGLHFTYHPQNLPGEVAGKASNQFWAVRNIAQMKKNSDPDYMIVSSVDADAVFHPNHFATLSWQFLTSHDRYNRIWQGAIIPYNNIHRIPGLMRIFSRYAMSCIIGDLVRFRGPTLFAIYHVSWRLLEKVGFGDRDVIADDFHFFFKAYFETNGKTQTEAIFLPIYTDSAEDHGFWKTFENTYEQIKRWAWGVTELFYFVKRYFADKKIPIMSKTSHLLWILEHFLLWPVYWFVLTLGLLGLKWFNPDFMNSLFGNYLSVFAMVTFGCIQVLFFASMAVSFLWQSNLSIAPFRHNKFLHIFEVLLMPIATLVFYTLPGLDAYTRALLGRKLQFRVTEKV